MSTARVETPLLDGASAGATRPATVGTDPIDALESRMHDAIVNGEPGYALPVERRAALDRVAALVRQIEPLLGAAAVSALAERIVARVSGLGLLEPLLDDARVSDVLVNGDGVVWVERSGRLEATGLVLSAVERLHLIERIVAPLGRHADRFSPLVDARLPDGSRVHAVLPPLAVDGPCLTIRRFPVRSVPLDDFGSPGVVALLTWAVRARANVVVSGGTGAGKTTLLNAMASHLPRGERIVTIEDAAELRLPGDHVVRLEARPANNEGAGAVTIRDLVRNALRMRPDRIVIGEVRGGEALDLLQAMNTGHEGSLSTCHANSPADALRRIETMVMMSDLALPFAAVREQVAAAIDLVVQVERRADGTRVVREIAEVDGLSSDGRLQTRPIATSGRLVALPGRARQAGGEQPDAGWLEVER